MNQGMRHYAAFQIEHIEEALWMRGQTSSRTKIKSGCFHFKSLRAQSVHCCLPGMLRRSLSSSLSCLWGICWSKVGNQAAVAELYVWSRPDHLAGLSVVVLFKLGLWVLTLRPLQDLRVHAPGKWSPSIWGLSKFWTVKSLYKSLSHKKQIPSELPFIRSVWFWGCCLF